MPWAPHTPPIPKNPGRIRCSREPGTPRGVHACTPPPHQRNNTNPNRHISRRHHPAAYKHYLIVPTHENCYPTRGSGAFPPTTVNNGRVGARCCSLKRPSIGRDGGHRNRSEKLSRRLHNVRFCIVPLRARVLAIAVLNYCTQTTLGNKLMTTD